MLRNETEFHRRQLIAHVLPMFLFLALLALAQWLSGYGSNVWFRQAKYWIYPVQTIVCGGLLFWFRDCYAFGQLRHVVFVLLIGAVVFLLWISPQQFFGFPPRTVGFDPASPFGNHGALYWATIIMRFGRLVLVVPFMEEIFWRAFLLRFLIDERFKRVTFGRFSWCSFTIVTLAFAFSHSRPDWPAALVTGAVYNLVAYRTGSLDSCILAHATTNLLLGLWVVQTQQWGFW
jgi:CAAX prenyl protease-like protein